MTDVMDFQLSSLLLLCFDLVNTINIAFFIGKWFQSTSGFFLAILQMRQGAIISSLNTTIV